MTSRKRRPTSWLDPVVNESLLRTRTIRDGKLLRQAQRRHGEDVLEYLRRPAGYRRGLRPTVGPVEDPAFECVLVPLRDQSCYPDRLEQIRWHPCVRFRSGDLPHRPGAVACHLQVDGGI